jgi:hypothetical protein
MHGNRPSALVRHCIQPRQECGLTPRSRRAPTAARASPAQAKVIIVLRGAYTLRCRARLTSNVRPHENHHLNALHSGAPDFGACTRDVLRAQRPGHL